MIFKKNSCFDFCVFCRFHEDYFKQCHKTVTQDDFDSYYVKHFDLIKKQILEKKFEERRRLENDASAVESPKRKCLQSERSMDNERISTGKCFKFHMPSLLNFLSTALG